MRPQSWRATSNPSVAAKRIGKKFHSLSPREAEVCGLVASRLSTQEIAKCLAISERTVEKHLEHIFKAFKVQSREQLRQRLGIQSPAMNWDPRR
jgi:DNA-binding CsgD family transcriptional regulator